MGKSSCCPVDGNRVAAPGRETGAMVTSCALGPESVPGLWVGVVPCLGGRRFVGARKPDGSGGPGGCGGRAVGATEVAAPWWVPSVSRLLRTLWRLQDGMLGLPVLRPLPTAPPTAPPAPAGEGRGSGGLGVPGSHQGLCVQVLFAFNSIFQGAKGPSWFSRALWGRSCTRSLLVPLGKCLCDCRLCCAAWSDAETGTRTWRVRGKVTQHPSVARSPAQPSLKSCSRVF